MLIALPVIVGSEWVTGVIAPMTPNGACSITARPWSPLKTSLRRNSTPGERSPERLELLDLVLQPADLGLFHLHRAQLDALVDGDAADVADDPPAVFQRAARELLEGLAGGGHGLVDAGELAEPALQSTVGGPLGPGGPIGPQATDHLFDDVANRGFRRLA